MAYADDDDKDMDIRQVSINKGQIAPFSGSLLSSDAVAKLLADRQAVISELSAEIESLRQSYEIKLQSLKDESRIREQSCENRFENEAKSCAAEKADLLKIIDRMKSYTAKKWYESPWVPLAGGVLLCIGSGITYGKAVQ